MKLFLSLLLFSFLLSCQSEEGSSETLTGVQSCSFFEDAQSCWRQSVAFAETCLWGVATQGTLAGDGTQCTQGGVTIDFNQAVNTSNPVSTENWNFEINDGAFCLAFEEEDSNFTLHTRDYGVFRAETFGSVIRYTCPDESTVSIDGLWALENCDLSLMPGTSKSSAGAPSFSFSFLGAPGVSNKGYSCQ
jgi:hypothetical protein